VFLGAAAGREAERRPLGGRRQLGRKWITVNVIERETRHLYLRRSKETITPSVLHRGVYTNRF
jgi:hypothetical protein